VGGGIAETFYSDTPGSLYVKTRAQVDGTNWGEATTYMDGLGRTYKAQVKDSQGDVFTETEYDVMGRVKRVTNPYRQGETKYWTVTNYDEAGRVKEIFSPTEDGQTPESKVTTEYGISTVPNFIGTYIIGTDQAGKKGRSITNALGQLLRVDETTGNNQLGDIASPNQPTFYAYSPQGQMVKVQQGNQYRYFLYDSLGRLLRVRQPEQDVNPDLDWNDPVTSNNNWTAAFTYDNNGNMLTATDAKGVVITNAYDNLNRVVTRSYALPQTTVPEKITFTTPNAVYKYDGVGASVPFAKGKLTEVSNGISTTKFTAFDNLGRLLSSEQITDGQVYKSSYKYNLSGLAEQTYPSGRVVKQVQDSTGHLMRVFGRAANRPEQTYLNEVKRSSDGRISRLRTGNGLWENAKFNSRLQITELALGASPTDTSLWKLNYEYGELDQNGSVDQAKNSGNIAKQILSYQGLANPFVQSFKYDSLDRLIEAKETTNGSQNWIQTFGYDRYGNRTSFNQTIGSQQLSINNLTLPSVDPQTNRFTTNQGYVYDFNGNLIVDAQSRKFSFNGDNKQVEVRDASNNLVGQYFYDSDGKRVKKISTSETTIFVYDGMGKLIEEYSTQQSPTPTTSYVVTDTLQSVQAVTNAQGQITSRRDFMPFGEELYAGTPNRTEALKYSQSGEDNIRKRFTGYEKDTETGLDFAEARYYNNQHGRFTAVDPLLSSGKSANPQTFNRYIYVMNQPLRFTDPSGMQAGGCPDWLCGVIIYITIRAYPFGPATEPVPTKDGWVDRYIANSPFPDENLGMERFQRATKDVYDEDAGPPRRLIAGKMGPTVDEVFQTVTDSKRLGLQIVETGLALQSLVGLASGFAPSGAATISTNRGIPLFGGSAPSSGFSFYARQDAFIRAEVARDEFILANPGIRRPAVIGGADIKSTLKYADTNGDIPTVFGQRMWNFTKPLGGPGAPHPCGNIVGRCAEFRVANQLELRGANPANLVFTRPQRLNPSANAIPVCQICQTWTTPSQFAFGTTFR
jgi:RHS repeat-associated protein